MGERQHMLVWMRSKQDTCVCSWILHSVCEQEREGTDSKELQVVLVKTLQDKTGVDVEKLSLLELVSIGMYKFIHTYEAISSGLNANSATYDLILDSSVTYR